MIVFCGGISRTSSGLQFQIAAQLLSRRGMDVTSFWSAQESEELERRLLAPDGHIAPGLIETDILPPAAVRLLTQGQAKAIYCVQDLRDVASSAMRTSGEDWAALKARKALDQAVATAGLWRAQPNTLVQSCEDFATDPSAAISTLARHLECKLQPDELSAIVQTIERANQTGKQVHESGNPPTSDSWKTTLSPHDAAELTALFSDWLNTHGYPLIALPESVESSDDVCFVPHVGWLEYERGDAVLTGLREGDFEYLEQAFLCRVLRPGDTVIDCGAHSGLYTKLCASRVSPGGKVHAIEPTAHSFARLTRNLSDQRPDAFELHPLALGDRNGSIRFATGNKGMSAYNHVATSVETDPTVDVAQLTLPAFLQRIGRKDATFLKIDAEGSELAILQAAESLLTEGVIPVLMIEFNQENLARYGGSCQALAALLGKCGYTLCALDSSRFRLVPAQPLDEQAYANFFAVKDLVWLQDRFLHAPAAAIKLATDIVQRGAQVSAQKSRLRWNIAEQDKFIANLQLERDRMAGEVEAAKTEAVRLVQASQQHIDSLKAQLAMTVAADQKLIDDLQLQLDRTVARYETHLTSLKNQLEQLAGTSRVQSDHIANMQNEHDRLALLAESQHKDITHYVKVINEQTAYIKHLESQSKGKQT